ncbi:MAG: hypothetical protein HOK92_07125 [Flavobacteriales bacterium]|nr:hypothetical protein [Flavobacteriales bacterium]
MKMLYKKSFYLLSVIVLGTFLYSCGAPGACDCKENDLLGLKADSTISADCHAAEEEMSRDDQNEYIKEYKSCK